MKSNRHLYWALIILSVAGYAWIGFHLFVGKTQEMPPACLVKNVSGIPCPSCGVTRSLLLLFSGSVQDSILMNPLGFFAAIALTVLPVWVLTDLLTQKNTLALTFLWTEEKIKTKKTVYIPLVALALLNWGWNILKGL
jgi:hypothetical protein